MRIKLATNSPLPKQNCWFGISEKQEKQTIHHLRKKIVKDLQLDSEPSNIQLLIDGFSLLPQTIIQDLVRDGDLITVKSQTAVEDRNTVKKRKISSVVEEEHDTKATAVKKSKKSTADKKSKDIKKKKSKDTKSKKEVEEKKDVKEKKSKETKSKKEAEEKVIKEKKLPKKSEKKKAKEDKIKLQDSTPIKKSLPFEGIPRTKKRNMRRRLLKKMRSATGDNSTATTAATVTERNPLSTVTSSNSAAESQIESLSISNIEPLQLIKKNKNKKKNHLKQTEQRSHVYYTPEEEAAPAEKLPAVQPTITAPIAPSNNTNHKNLYGRAFVTFVESDPKYKGRNNTSKHPPREYPINHVPTLFYANQGFTEEELTTRSLELEQAPVDCVIPESIPLEEEKEKEPVNEPEKPINYEQDFPEANFTSNIPTIGAKLAIKTLELTAAYTPEISDWKQVILKEFNETAGQITVEYLPGFGKATTKGGKFDIRKKKKSYDDWYEEEEEEEEEPEEVQTTIEVADVFAVRNMSL